MALRDPLDNASGYRVSTNFELVELNGAFRQYSGGRDRKGNRLIYINAFCRTPGKDLDTGSRCMEFVVLPAQTLQI